MADVVFVTPNFDGQLREEPVGTLLLATILKNAEIPTEIIQFRHFGDIQDFELFIDCAIKKILEKQPKIVSFYTRCDTYHISLTIAQRIKQEKEDVWVVFAGPQADLSCEDTLDQISYVDFICCGEGETTVVPFFSSLISGEPDLTIRGLAYRDGNTVVKNPRPELISDLNTLPSIDYTLTDFNNELKGNKVRQLFPVDVGRGCPFACSYCSTKNVWGRKYRLKSAERIVEEIKEINRIFGVTNFNFEHDMFTMNRDQVVRICGMLKDLDFPISWRCSARMDCLDKELIDIMVDAGMELLFVGIETGSPRMQKIIHKNLKLDSVYSMLEYICNKGVYVTASFMFGIPEETEEDFSQTIELMLRLGSLPHINVQHHLCTFLYGTELTEKYGRDMRRLSKESDITGEIAVKECEALINEHPSIFPHYFEYQTEFRNKIKYYPYFYYCFRLKASVYQYIADKYYQNRLCEMLFDFTACNIDALDAGADKQTVAEQDKFIEKFADVEKYALIKEVNRFILWRRTAHNGDKEVFGFDVSEFIKCEDLSNLHSAFCVVTYTTDSSGMASYLCQTAGAKSV